MKTVLFLVLLFVGSYALRSNTHLRHNKGANDMSAARDEKAENSAVQERKEKHSAGKERPERAERSPAMPETEGSDEAPKMDYPAITENEKKLLLIHNEEEKRIQELFEKCALRHKECYDVAGDDEEKKIKCDGDFEREDKDGVQKIRDEMRQKVEALVGKVDDQMEGHPEVEVCEANIKFELEDRVYRLVGDKFHNFVMKQEKHLLSEKISYDDIRITLEDILAKVNEENKQAMEEFKKFGEAWLNGEIKKFHEVIKERLEKTDSNEIPAEVEEKVREKVENFIRKRQEKSKEVSEEKRKEIRASIAKKVIGNHVRHQIRKAFINRIVNDVENFMKTNEEFKAEFERFKERVMALIKERFPDFEPRKGSGKGPKKGSEEEPKEE